MFVEISAKTGENITRMFEDIGACVRACVRACVAVFSSRPA